MGDEAITFSRNYHDLSTQQGFQFEFYCDHCHGARRTRFQPSTLGTVSSALGAVSSFFGGFLSGAADLSERARSATWERAHDEAFLAAVEESRPHFRQCPGCQRWVCSSGCWNQGKGLCKSCAPDLGVVQAQAQAQRSVEELHAHARMADADRALLKEDAWRQGATASCPSCQAALPGGTKFCPECGARIQQRSTCGSCNADLPPGSKFCGECGAKAG